MVIARALILGAVIALAGAFSPAWAGRWWPEPIPLSYWDIRDAIYERVNLIAHLEANPEVDESFKGPIITRARAEIHQLRALIGAPPSRSPTPCCYSRHPLHIR